MPAVYFETAHMTRQVMRQTMIAMKYCGWAEVKVQAHMDQEYT